MGNATPAARSGVPNFLQSASLNHLCVFYHVVSKKGTGIFPQDPSATRRFRAACRPPLVPSLNAIIHKPGRFSSGAGKRYKFFAKIAVERDKRQIVIQIKR